MTWADHAFDAVRMTWIVAILGVIFYDLNMGDAFLAGAVGGVGYVVLASIVRMMFAWCVHVYRMRRWEREREAQEREMSRERVERERRRRGMAGIGSGDLSQPLIINIH